MRMRLLREGVPTEDGRIITPNGITWEEPIPVYDRSNQLIGHVDKIRREREGWITGVVHRVVLGKGWGLVATVSEIMDDDRENISGRLRAVAVGQRTVWPGMKVR